MGCAPSKWKTTPKARKNRRETNWSRQKLSKKTKKNTRTAKMLKKKEKETDKCHSDQKVDFPEPLVRAHQGAYAFLNPSIVKYDSTFAAYGGFMALRYEELIYGLEEMAEEGEKVFKEYGEHLAWPSQMKTSHPQLQNLLQQLLQYTTQRMCNVSHSVGRLGDSALEEAMEYFASVSELLEEKLKAKHTAETRLMHLLCRIEMASVRKPGPEDSALFSEDSGIGGENESVAGSDKQHRPESSGSSRTNRTMSASPKRYNSFPRRQRSSSQMFTNQISPSVSLTSLNSLGSTCTILANEHIDSLLGSFSGEDDEDEEHENMKDKRMLRPRSVSVDSDQPKRIPHKRIENPQNMEMTLKMKNAISGRIQFSKSKAADSPKRNRQQWTEDKEQTPKRPQTLKSGQKDFKSLKSRGEDPTLLELERTQKDLNQKLQKLSKNKVSNIKTPAAKPNQKTPIIQSPRRIRKSTSLEKNVQASGNKVSTSDHSKMKQEEMNNAENPNKSDEISTKDIKVNTPLLLHHHQGHTFSQGVEELEGPKVLGPLRGVKKCGVPVIPGLGNMEAVLSKNRLFRLGQPASTPIEVLMDKSFESAKSLSTGLSDDGVSKVNKSPLLKRAMVSQRLKASVQPVTVLPSKEVEETPAASKLSQPEPPQKENNVLYQQARRIINLRSSHAEKPAGCVSSETSFTEDKSMKWKIALFQCLIHTPQYLLCLLQFQLPMHLLLRHERYPRRPQPQVSFIEDSQVPAISEDSLPHPPPAVLLQPALHQAQPFKEDFPAHQWPSKHINLQSYFLLLFQSPITPASPKLHRWSRENSREDLSRKLNNARSVFCPASPSLFEAPPCPVPKPPEAWTSSRVSLLSRMWGGSRPFIRRTQSDRRPSLNLPPQSPIVSYAETCGSEPMIYSPGLDDDPLGEEDIWGSQSELRATLRSASHPDLCVVGQSLHMD
ncbi:hypothetical protein WMY93_017126 [Mugilogobius chulae]|uniref:Photoreceptor cilium actin regulator n=1 Tax=Mugilogobius chulae TaxID=88201 RepID=A0AAW0NZI7_9GOBI